MQGLEAGAFDPRAEEPELDFVAPSSPNTSLKKEKDDVKDEEDFLAGDGGLDEEAGDNGAGESKMDSNGRGVSGGFDAGGARKPRSDEIAVEPEGNQVMIRTIPPDIGRVKLEAVCGYYLLMNIAC